MSLQAVTWVLEDAPEVPAHLVATLLGLANHAGDDGRNAYPGQGKLAGYTRKSERAVRKDLRELQELGLVRRGDQRWVDHIRVDRRPIVFDLAVERKCEAAGTGVPAGTEVPHGSTIPGGIEVPPGTALPGGTPVSSDRNCGSEATGTTVPTNRKREPLEEPSDSYGELPLSGVQAAEPTAKKRRTPDVVWDAVVAACGIDGDQLTKSARGACNAAVKDLKGVGATANDVAERAITFRRKWPHLELTPTALAKNWPFLANAQSFRPAGAHGGPSTTTYAPEEYESAF